MKEFLFLFLTHLKTSWQPIETIQLHMLAQLWTELCKLKALDTVGNFVQDQYSHLVYPIHV